MEMIKNKATIFLIVFILGIAFIGGLQDKKTVADDTTTNYIANDLQK